MKKEVLLIVLFYALMGVFYQAVLNIDIGRWLNPMGMIINFLLKAILTIPLIWLFFKKLASLSIWKKGGLHLITMPLFTLIWIYVYYLCCDYYGLFRLEGQRVVWDVYLTLLFYAIQFGVFHIYNYSKELRAQELLAAELKRLNAESELSALKAQLNPHFLYNVFNTINSAIPTTAKNARNMVNELSDLFRYQLKASREEFVPLQEELDFVRKYLDLEQQRFAERLRYEINVDEEIKEELIPPIVLQPIVENAIKHGLSSLIEGGVIKIAVHLHNGMLQFSICDTGTGIGSKNKEELLNKGVGLSNTNERLLKTYNTSLDLTNNIPQGLCVNFSIPLHKTQEL
ncbi:MAG: sensor histidine kinase [Flavobacteriales bacterium]